MIYQKNETLAYNIHTIQTDRFKKTVIRINFKRKMERKDITYRNLLGDILLETCQKYPTRRELTLETEDLYGISMGYNLQKSGIYSILSFQFTYLNDMYTEENNSAKVMELIYEILFHPNVADGKFDASSFEKSKASLKEAIESRQENHVARASRRLIEEMFPDSVASYVGPGYLEDLETVDAAKLYDYYLSVLNSDIIDIFICGNFKEADMVKSIKENFKVNTVKRAGKSHYINDHHIRKRCKIVKEPCDSKQSILQVGYKIDHPTDFERNYVGRIYNNILGVGLDSHLAKVIREKYSLCYSIHSSRSPVTGYMVVEAGINALNFKKTMNLIRKIVREMAEKSVTQEEIDKANMIYLTALKENEDSPYTIISTYQTHEYLNTDLPEKIAQETKKVTPEMISDYAAKIKLDTIYLLEGEMADEKDTTF